MNKIFLMAIILMFPALLIGQDKEQTLFGSDSIDIGFYGGPDFKFTVMDDYFGVFSGGKGGVIFGGAFSFGGAGYNLITNNHYVDVLYNGVSKTVELNMTYGGFIFE